MKIHRGFTLIELLVVISIISLLSSVLLSSLSSARLKARDTQRIQAITQLETALALYHSDNARYPISSSGCTGSTQPNAGWCNSVQTLSNGRWIKTGTTAQLTNYIGRDPVDPQPSTNLPSFNGTPGAYYYFSAGPCYIIVFSLEAVNHPLEVTDRKRVATCSGASDYHGNSAVTVISD